jgi:hypothetical protein
MNNPLLKRFWFEFDNSTSAIPFGAELGIGVTAYNYDDAINVITNEIFKKSTIPTITKLIEDVDVSTLEANHVLPNIGVSSIRGVWYPRLYLH